MRIAPPNNGAEGSKVGIALLATNFNALSSSNGRFAVSGQIRVRDQLAYTAPGASVPLIDEFSTFLKLHATPAVTVSKPTRTATIRGDADGRVHLYRFDVVNNAGLTWTLWTERAGSPTAARDLVFPDPTSVDPTLIDPLQDAVGSGGTPGPAIARLVGLQLTASTTAEALETFGPLTLDRLGGSLTGFTALLVPVSP
jgi:hypothetical protein